MTRQPIRILLFIFLSVLICLSCSAKKHPVQSFQCPNKLQCKQRLYDNLGNSSDQTMGTLDVKCCYTFPVGCRPWHCDKDKTNFAYWQAVCDKTFPSCRDNHAGYTDPFCTPHFKTY